MRLVIATPLYPPDIAAQALYVKELAQRLSEQHTLTIVTYGHFPEKIEGVTILMAPKRAPLAARLSAFTTLLQQALTKADALLIENGPSTELPFIRTSFSAKTPRIFCISDVSAHKRAGRNPLLALLESLARGRSTHTLATLPLARPEILPLLPYPTEAMAAFESSWEKHLSDLNTLLHLNGTHDT